MNFWSWGSLYKKASSSVCFGNNKCSIVDEKNNLTMIRLLLKCPWLIAGLTIFSKTCFQKLLLSLKKKTIFKYFIKLRGFVWLVFLSCFSYCSENKEKMASLRVFPVIFPLTRQQPVTRLQRVSLPARYQAVICSFFYQIPLIDANPKCNLPPSLRFCLIYHEISIGLLVFKHASSWLL